MIDQAKIIALRKIEKAGLSYETVLFASMLADIAEHINAEQQARVDRLYRDLDALPANLKRQAG